MAFLNKMWRLLRDESGQDSVEYALLSLAVALASVVGVSNVAAGTQHAIVRADHIFTSAVSACLHHRTGG